MKEKILLIDGDIYAYRVAAAVQDVTNWGDGEHDEDAVYTTTCCMQKAMYAFNRCIAEFCGAYDVDKGWIFLSGPNNWRYGILPDYKANRAGVRPIGLRGMRQLIQSQYFTYQNLILEADDFIGITATNPSILESYDPIIVTEDKDLKQIPGKHAVGSTGEIVDISPKEAEDFHLTQLLAGDPTDGYSGCPGFGMVTAQKFVEAPYFARPSVNKEGKKTWKKESTCRGNTWGAIVTQFQKAHNLDDFEEAERIALVQARVAHILHYEDYDAVNNQVISWLPGKINYR